VEKIRTLVLLVERGEVSHNAQIILAYLTDDELHEYRDLGSIFDVRMVTSIDSAERLQNIREELNQPTNIEDAPRVQ
jgi:hypothetical protein